MFKYPYKLTRSSRRSVSVTVNCDNTLTVRAPYRYSVAEIEKFLNKKLGWIERCFTKNADINEDLSDVISQKCVLVGGKKFPLVFGGRNLIGDNFVSVKSLSGLRKLYTDALGNEFLNNFNRICRENGFICNGVSFKDYRSRWGCCDAKKRIVFNYKLLMLPADIQRYVIVHELCHTVHMNHSAEFYALVSSVCSDYKALQKRLKSYSVLIRMY